MGHQQAGTEPENIVSKQTRQCMEDSERWFPAIAHSVIHHGIGLAGEAGEVCNIIKKAHRGDIDLHEPLQRHRLAMELVDTYIYLLNLAGILGVDLSKAYEVKRRENLGRFGNGSGTTNK